ncbi:DUF4089 domain-containing protein [Comamonas endophytica]|uniref:DUF4089 domain-containing protein n=1 Tax=Comamonas endophytica TaxID=2949090 RepID=A0ABY6GFK8_9BURK|nr:MULTISPECIES: DUF4089 domain-containing protein [unclassified Acidovorax]MCD2512480.1 DUF4089 domain-containing protein [Acidovorax sp. D4N7]UYG53152.1 DUF4089 domain-containing protein [Acidovorax sp. 5MLIR]
MEEQEILTYVKAAAPALGLTLDAQRAAAVAQHFGRTVAMARLLEQAQLAPEDELAEIYCPAPFPVKEAQA